MSFNTFSTIGLIAWLETQDPATEYRYLSRDNCLLCLYFRDRGVPLHDRNPVDGYYWEDKDGNRHALPEGLGNIAAESPYTYGAALTRAKATLAA